MGIKKDAGRVAVGGSYAAPFSYTHLDKLSPYDFQLPGGSLFFFYLSLNLSDTQPDNITAVLVELLTAKIQIPHNLFIRADFELNIFRVFGFGPACTGRHPITSLSVYTFIIRHVYTESQYFLCEITKNYACLLYTSRCV